MKIKKLPVLHKQERVQGEWVNGRFFPFKNKTNGRLPQLGKRMKKKTVSEAVAIWRELDQNESPRRV